MESLEGRGIVGLSNESIIDDRVIWAGVTVVPGSGCIVHLSWIEEGLSRMILVRNSLDVLM